MRRALLSGFALALGATAIVVVLGSHGGDRPEAAYTLVRVESSAAGDTVLREGGATLVSATLGVWRLRTREAAEVIRRLKDKRVFRAAERDRRARPLGHLSAGDPLIRSWLTSVGADRAEPPGPGKPVTVIDSGLDLTHPEFAGRPNTISLNEQRPRGRSEELFHGTAVSSLIAAPANGIGLVGVYPQAVLKEWDVVGGLSDVVAGLDAASRSGPGVINLSLGFDEASELLEDAVALAVSRGSLVVAAGGNERGESVRSQWPQSYPHVLTIAATDQRDAVTDFSNDAEYIDLSAPGENIPVAVPTSYRQSGFLNSASGTSFSAPIVSGAAAWVWTMRPELDNLQLFDVIRRSARDLAPAGFDTDTGYGMLDIPAALAAPAQARDPHEPNEDVRLVRPNGLFEAGKPALTAPGRSSASLSARLEKTEDPRDVYRVWVPARRTLVARLTGQGDSDLEAWRGGTPSIRVRGAARTRYLVQRSASRGSAADVVRIKNATARGAYYFVSALAVSRQSSYRLALSTQR